MQKKGKIILGIDPGTLFMGYAVIEVQNDKIQYKDMNVLRMSGKKSNHERLFHIHQKINQLISLHQPAEFAIEAPFYGKNVQSMLKLGRAQGVAIAAAMQAGLPVFEYSPKKIKQSVTGNGNADKMQIWKMLQQTLNITDTPDYFDATDALAIAVCHHYQSKLPLPVVSKSKKKSSAWDDFIKLNPERLKK